jgi:hypothetical protein
MRSESDQKYFKQYTKINKKLIRCYIRFRRFDFSHYSIGVKSLNSVLESVSQSGKCSDFSWSLLFHKASRKAKTKPSPSAFHMAKVGLMLSLISNEYIPSTSPLISA